MLNGTNADLCENTIAAPEEELGGYGPVRDRRGGVRGTTTTTTPRASAAYAGTTSTASCGTTPSPGEGHHHRRVRDSPRRQTTPWLVLLNLDNSPQQRGRVDQPQVTMDTLRDLFRGELQMAVGQLNDKVGQLEARNMWIPRKFCRSVYVYINGTGTRPFSENHPFAAD